MPINTIKVDYIHKLNEPEKHKLKTHNNPATFAKIDQYHFGLEEIILFLLKNQPEAYSSLQHICFQINKKIFSIDKISKNTILYGLPGLGRLLLPQK